MIRASWLKSRIVFRLADYFSLTGCIHNNAIVRDITELSIVIPVSAMIILLLLLNIVRIDCSRKYQVPYMTIEQR